MFSGVKTSLPLILPFLEQISVIARRMLGVGRTSEKSAASHAFRSHLNCTTCFFKHNHNFSSHDGSKRYKQSHTTHYNNVALTSLLHRHDTPTYMSKVVEICRQCLPPAITAFQKAHPRCVFFNLADSYSLCILLPRHLSLL